MAYLALTKQFKKLKPRPQYASFFFFAFSLTLRSRFGGDPNDLPLESICRTIMDNAAFVATNKLPPVLHVFEPRNEDMAVSTSTVILQATSPDQDAEKKDMSQNK